MKYTLQDFKSDQEVKWCPGCGDHAVLASVLRSMPSVCEELGINKEKLVFVSGIGCSSRFPYYMNTYGFHGIHGRATALSTGMKVANPELCIWQMTGDGDSLAIGGNHFIHAIRRNIDINVLLFNNRIYGLTKGQYSPTSKFGLVTKTSPYGTIEQPFTPGQLVLGARGTFFARTLDYDLALNQEILPIAAKHKGTSIIEFCTNCVIYNDGTHKEWSARELRDDTTITLRHGEKMLFGKNKEKGIVLDRETLQLKVVKLGENGITEKDILVHDAHSDNVGIHTMLVNMKYPDYPVALGVIRDVEDKTYDENLWNQVCEVEAKAKIKTVDELLHSGATWTVEK